MDEEGGHDAAQVGPHAHPQQHADNCQPAVQHCLGALLAIACMRKHSSLRVGRSHAITREVHKSVHAIAKQLSADVSTLQAMLHGSVISMHSADQEHHTTYRSNKFK